MLGLSCFSVPTAHAQTFRFNLRAEPDILPANGISTSAILVQVQNYGGSSISAAPIVRFMTTAGSIESQARLTGGVARVLLRSSTTPGTATITAFIGSAREQVTVEFTNEDLGIARYLMVKAPYVAYGPDNGIITASGRTVFDFGETRIESDVRLDVDLLNERIWAEGGAGKVIIRHGEGKKAHELRGDRLYYDIRRRRGVIRRIDTALGPDRQEFMDSDFKPIPDSAPKDEAPHDGTITPVPIAPKAAAITTPLTGAKPKAAGVAADAPATTSAPSKQASTPSNAPVTPTSASITPATIQPINADSGAGQFLKKVLLDDEPKPSPQNSSKEPVSTPDSATLPPPDSSADKQSVRTALNEGSGAMKATDQAPADIPDYAPIIPDDAAAKKSYRINEPAPPQINDKRGYWIVSHQVTVYPHDKLQFRHATLFYGGRKLFSMPLYVASLKSSFNPAQDMASLNSVGGLSLNVPYYYQASPRGTGTLYFQHAPSNGFAAERAGFALAVDQEYWLSKRSQGRLFVDQLGRGAWNLNWQHKLQFSPTMNGELFLDMPRHRDQFMRASLLKEFRAMQVGFEGIYTRPDGSLNNSQGQFFARLRPRQLGGSKWTYTLAANAIAIQRYTNFIPVLVPPVGGDDGNGNGGGGGIGLPGRRRASTIGQSAAYQALAARGRSVIGQTFNATLQAPGYNLWKGASLQASLLGTAYNYSNGRRGAAPGLTLGLQQNIGRFASMQLNYNYERGGISLAGTDYTNFLSGNAQFNFTRKLGASAFFSKSLDDGSLYGMTTLDYFVSPKWRIGLFSDYASFGNTGDFLNYGWSLGRMIGQRELTLNWDHDRNRVYFELGGFRY